MTTRHWGDIPVITDADSGIVALEREQLIKPRPLEIEDPTLYSPYSRAGFEGDYNGPSSHRETISDPEQFDADPITLHTIALVQHSRKMKALIQQAQQQIRESSKNDKTEAHLAPVIPFPEYPETGKVNQKRLKPCSFQRPIGKTNFNSGIGSAPTQIDSIDCRRLIRRSIATVCAHIGFDLCKESALELLVDVTREYYQRITKHLRSAVDSQLLLGHSGFPDVIEQVFRECGVGSVRDLEDFYNNRVLRYHESMVNQCQQLVLDYEKLLQANKAASEKPAAATTPVPVSVPVPVPAPAPAVGEVKIKEEVKEEPTVDSNVSPPADEEEKEDVMLEMEEFHMEALGPMEICLEQDAATTSVPELEYTEPVGMAEEQGIVKEIILDTDDEITEFKEET